MDRRTLLAVSLSLLIYVGWVAVMGPAEVPPEELPEGENPVAEAPVAPAPAPAPEPVVELAPEEHQEITGCGTIGEVSSDGGIVRSLYLPDSIAAYEVTPLYQWLINGVTGDGFDTWKPYGDPPGAQYILEEDGRGLGVGAGPWGGPVPRLTTAVQGDELRVQGPTGVDGIEVNKTVTVTPATDDHPCTFTTKVTWTNNGSGTYQGDVWISVHDQLAKKGADASQYASVRRPMAYVDDDLEYANVGIGEGTHAGGCDDYQQAAVVEKPLAMEGPVSWFGIHDRYFGLLVVPDAEPATGRVDFSLVGDVTDEENPPLSGVHYNIPVNLGPGASHTESFTVYAGSLNRTVLGQVHEDLPYAVDLGVFAFFGLPLLWLLELIHSLMGNWGLSIILLTVIIKAAFFPMTQSSFKSMQKMQALRPKIDEINKEFADNPQELQRRTMALFSEEGVNPVAGCLPMVAQMPVWFSLYNALLTSVALYQAEFLYIKDLSAPDPYSILPVAIMGLFLLQQRFTTLPENADPAQVMVTRLMPLIFGIMFFALPAGLGVYVFVNVSLSILQQWLIKRQLDDPPATGAADPA